MSERIPVTVLGATGVVGQRFVERLAHHPRFEIRHLGASESSVGKRYADACSWRLSSTAYGGLEEMIVTPCVADEVNSPVVFSALDTAPAREIEPAFAAAGALVFSNASAYRMAADVPLLVPEVNAEHLQMLTVQRRERGWSGGIVCNPNCTASVLVMGLGALHDAFDIEAIAMTSMQGVSGAGYPGVASLDILGNIVPYIGNEEEKVQEETPKMLGTVDGDRFVPADFTMTALCHRAAVVDGHMEAVSVRLSGDPTPDEVAEAMRAWQPEPQRLGLHSAPHPPVRLYEQLDRPQPRLDVERAGGMPVHVGRIRRCPLLGIKFTLLGHNTQRGAAGASVLNAELAVATGYLS